ncbi:MAG TPA: prepilin-type N-terminal cleavage/methylation domain-containing protein, partial [Gemmatimonadaceae bacterium]|nr:prepilin-type N-terminal cleavage/methylation domain-containing protein [Gemmatimonadaceae bacterium]
AGEYFAMSRNPILPSATRGSDRATKAGRRGFTLVELLVVVLVIGILVAIAIPRYSGSKDKAYVAAMIADLHNAAIYEEQYASENHAQYFSGTATADVAVQGFRASKDITVTLTATNILGSRISEFTAVARHTQSKESCELRSGIIACTTGEDQTSGVIPLG